MPLSTDINWSDKKNMKEAQTDMLMNIIYHLKIQRKFYESRKVKMKERPLRIFNSYSHM